MMLWRFYGHQKLRTKVIWSSLALLATGVSQSFMQEQPKAASKNVIISVPSKYRLAYLRLHSILKVGFSGVVPILIYLSSNTKLLIPLACLEAVLLGAYFSHRHYYGLQITHLQLTEDRKNAILRLGTAGPQEEFSVEISKNRAVADNGQDKELFSLIHTEAASRQVALMAPQDYAAMETDVTNYELARLVMLGDQQQVDQYEYK